MLTLAVAELAAQSQTSPPGAVRGLFGGSQRPNSARSSQQVSLWFDVGVGVDNAIGEAEVPGAPPSSRDQTAAGAFRYWLGRSTRSLEAQARAYRTSNQAVDSALGGEMTLTGNLGMGRRHGATANLRVANESARLFGAFGPSASVPTPPDDTLPPVTDVSPPSGVVENRWLTVSGGVNGFRRWTPRQRTNVQYAQMTMQPRQGNTLDSSTKAVVVQHDWNPRPNTGFLAAYRFDQIDQSFGSVVTEPIRFQSLEAGLRRDFRSSANRLFSIALLGGVTQIQSVATPLANVEGQIEPKADFRATYTLSRQWLVSGGVGTGVTALNGVSVDAFRNDFASANIAGVIARRVTISLGSTWSRGASVGVSPGTFVASNTTATLQYGFRYGGVFVGLMRYTHELSQVLNPAEVIPPLIDRYSVRAGFTLWLPLYGAF